MSNIPHEDAERDRRQKAIDDIRDSLDGLFSGLVIIGTWELETGETATVQATNGNWHAQNGMIAYLHRKRMAQADLDAKDQHTPPEETA